MKLYMKDGRLRFDYEFEQTDIFTGADFDFSYIGDGAREYIPYFTGADGWLYPYELNWSRLGACVALCKERGVTITPEAQAYIDEFKAKADEDMARHEADKERKEALKASAKAKAEWIYKQTHGCKGCPYLRYKIDMPLCKATGRELAEENVADHRKASSYIGGVYNIFEFVPFPDENCPFKTEPMTKEEMDVAGYEPATNMESRDSYNKTFGRLLR